MHTFISFVLIALLLGFIGLFIYSLYQIIKESPTIKEAWRKTDILERNMLIMGLIIFVFIPALKSHPSADWYFAKVIIEILPALAGSFFVAGVVSFMSQVHKIKNNA